MAVTNYDTYNGRVFSETTNGVQLDYLHDALGSVVATVDQTAMLVNTYRYKPYGDLLAKTGVAADPKFLWVGGWGYRNTTNVWAEKYVRARHYGVRQAGWTTVDKRWPIESGYKYGDACPTTTLDYSGNQASRGRPSPRRVSVKRCSQWQGPAPWLRAFQHVWICGESGSLNCASSFYMDHDDENGSCVHSPEDGISCTTISTNPRDVERLCDCIQQNRYRNFVLDGMCIGHEHHLEECMNAVSSGSNGGEGGTPITQYGSGEHKGGLGQTFYD